MVTILLETDEHSPTEEKDAVPLTKRVRITRPLLLKKDQPAPGLSHEAQHYPLTSPSRQGDPQERAPCPNLLRQIN